MAFHVGKKVVRVAVDKSIMAGCAIFRGMKIAKPQIGQTYTIRAINVWPRYTILRFHEFDNSHLIGFGGSSIEPGWDSRGFRPVIERKSETDISVFREILDRETIDAPPRRVKIRG